MLNKIIKRGEIYSANLGNRDGSIQSGTRPVVIISNDMNNKFSPTVNVLPITSKTKNSIPVHVNIGKREGLQQESTILTEQIVTVDKSQLKNFIGKCDKHKLYEIEKAIILQNGIDLHSHSLAI